MMDPRTRWHWIVYEDTERGHVAHTGFAFTRRGAKKNADAVAGFAKVVRRSNEGGAV